MIICCKLRNVLWLYEAMVLHVHLKSLKVIQTGALTKYLHTSNLCKSIQVEKKTHVLELEFYRMFGTEEVNII